MSTPQDRATKPRMSQEQLLKFDFGTLPDKDLQLLEKLSFLSVHNSMYQILTKPFGDSRYKQKCIRENLNALGPDDEVDYNLNKMDYNDKVKTFLPLVLCGFTFGAYLTAVWRLPSRKSTAMYTITGFGCGLAVSYGLWRYWTFQYYQKLNRHFGKILKFKYMKITPASQ